MTVFTMTKPPLSASPDPPLIGSAKKPLLGFSTGCLYKSIPDELERLRFLKNCGCRVIELGLVKLEVFEKEVALIERSDLSSFDYVSLHAPVAAYGYNAQTYKIFTMIDRLDQLRHLDLVVVHPDTVENFGVFNMRYRDFNFAFENMDKRKNAFKLIYDMIGLRILSGFKMVLDVNHAYTNDPTLALTAKFYENFGKDIVEIHLSGYAGYHEPLFKTRQAEIIKSIQNPKVPIIVEGILDPEEIILERDYILKVLAEA